MGEAGHSTVLRKPLGGLIGPRTCREIDRRGSLHARLIVAVEARRPWAVEIEYADKTCRSDQRYDEFRAGIGIAGDMTRKFVHIRDDDGLPAQHSRAADTLASRDAHASRLALKRSDDKLIILAKKIEADPIHVGHGVEQQSDSVRGIGDRIGFACEQRIELLGEFAIELRLAGTADGAQLKHVRSFPDQTASMMETRTDTNGPSGLFAAVRGAMPPGERAFLRTADGSVVTYAEMYARTGRLANCLWRAGVHPGDRVAAYVEKSAEALLLYLASLRMGAVYLPLNPGYTMSEMRYFVGDAEPACVVVSPEKERSIAPLSGAALLTLSPDGRSGSLVSQALELSSRFPDVACRADDLAAILYTSGTTGRPKGAMLTQHNLLSNALVLRDLWRFTQVDVLLHALPLYHTHGLFTATNTMLLAGASMILLSTFDLDGIFAQLPDATSMMGVPTFYTRMLADRRLDRSTTGHLRLIVSGSAPLAIETHRSWIARTGRAILERYGMTETNMIASNPCAGERIAGTVGFPLPGVEVRIVDRESGSSLPENEIGMIEVRGPNVFKGYWRSPRQTEQSFRVDGFFVTGDLGTFDARGYLHIVGREKDVVISGGANVYPKEVEMEIDALPGIVESAVIGVPHPDFGEGVTAIVVPDKDAALDEAGVLSALAARLAKYKLPKRILFEKNIPRNAMGKVRKNALRGKYRNLYG